MWRTILVEDEEYVRTELAELFPWQPYDFVLVGEAENAQTAMDLIEEVHPDLVITDLRMPEMDGLELISWIVQHFPEIVVTVISAYNDFPSVRKALRLGASDYLIKAELTQETAGAFLKRIGKILTERRYISEQQKKLTDHMEHYRLLASEAFWRDLLTGSIAQREIQTKASQLGLELDDLWFSLIFIHVAKKDLHRNVGRILNEALTEGSWAVLDWEWSWRLVKFKRGDYVVILSRDGQKPKQEELEQIEKCAHDLRTRITISITLSVSLEADKYLGLPRLFKEAKNLNLLRLYFPEKRYITNDDISVIRQASAPDIPRLLNTWEEALRNIHADSELALLNSFLDTVFIDIIPVCLTPEEARWLVLDLIRTFHWVLFEYRVRWDQVIGRGRDYLEIIEEVDSIADWQSMLRDLAVKFRQFVQKRQALAVHPQISLAVRKAVAYIQANYHRDLSLEEVATHAGVSMSYLSRAFPEYVGDNFSNYLRNLRIERAKELLLFTNEYIYEIASKVGFWNSRYFSKVFHDTVGMSPVDYRRVHNEQDQE